MKKIVVNKKHDNKKLNNLILDTFPNLNKNALFKALRKKDIRVNNIKVSDNVIVHSGDEITIYIVDDILLGEFLKIEKVYEDDNILIVNKPENLSVTDDSSDNNNLTCILRKQENNTNIMPCHRIDRNTKGLVLFAKNNIALKILLDKFRNKEIEKHYFTKVYGIIPKNHDILKAYLFKDSKKNIVYISDIPKKNYQKIITEYSVIKKDIKNNITTLDINLLTGRTHQIRAHFSHLGYPILGDGKYGINEINKKFNLKTQFLYSYKIKFNFSSNSGILNYLNGKEIILKNDIISF